MGKQTPRDLNRLNEHKLTRRRVMKAAAAAGMSSAAVLTMTPDDVKAADSDQVTIPFDTEGEEKKQIAADVLDWYYRARDATDKIKEAHFGKDGVHRVATRGGGQLTMLMYT
ncbi:twin-arginine translocation signal domain-containing protein [Natronomonas gomsonensis]|uniref:twin-arginine translocation signal domain-containing protein n=1 Tax=Natronomonas gomsonensis TaxID=1046043 RepID=UPI0020CA5967|nr:twin-arginine translocation signal domain-containing protein [Natronomonas gomsonensis]MCY4729814.1 twin-arginine translocation signal domain-containing protein [Natronomonas gomsonensis]